MSSIREVLQDDLILSAQLDRFDPWQITKRTIRRADLKKALLCGKGDLYVLSRFSPIVAAELAYRSGLDADDSTATLGDAVFLLDRFRSLLQDLSDGNFSYGIYYDPVTGAPKEFAPIPLTIYSDMEYKTFLLYPRVLEAFCAQRNKHTDPSRSPPVTTKIVSIHLERDRKYLLQKKAVG